MASTPKRSGREPQLLKSVGDAAQKASSLEEALRAALQRICAATGWQAGRVEFADEVGELARHIVWHLERPERLGTLRRIAERRGQKRGEGVPRPGPGEGSPHGRAGPGGRHPGLVA